MAETTIHQHGESAPETPSQIDVLVEDSGWDAHPGAQQAATRAGRRALEHAGKAADGSEVCILLADDERLRTLNRDFRGKDTPTNVLSFSQEDAADGYALGDVAVARETVEREAEALGRPVIDHLSHLAVHGILHLLGYDHDSDADAMIMERLERDILATLAIPDPYLQTPGTASAP